MCHRHHQTFYCMSLAFAVYRYATPMTSRNLKYFNFSYSVFNVYRNGYHNKFDLVINIDDDRFVNCRSISSLTTKISLEYNWTGRITRRQMCQSPCLIDEGSRPRDFHLRDSFIPSGRVVANKRKEEPAKIGRLACTNRMVNGPADMSSVMSQHKI